jgi:hypothetical protein
VAIFVTLIHILISVIHACLAVAAEALVAGSSVVVGVLITIAILVGVFVTGMGGFFGLRRKAARRREGGDS